ncbi:hypothetical protein LAG90_02965 [Marinilongibacter aquaticus]|uniref:3-coathanger stack domain-containing protein n=1 Tax=Marinilongibacter aquaticus TaxID=2975157 RepID=UPI0021BD3A25|nr:3-coathanger stack domain-containing protein [Marinilongibacter aquaticus]UBM59612.1 hypothetical protein LAG90_02965 [Marinilongibacter aquaticus]
MKNFYLFLASMLFPFFWWLNRQALPESAVEKKAVVYAKSLRLGQNANDLQHALGLVPAFQEVDENWRPPLGVNVTAVKSFTVEGGGNVVPGAQLNYTIVLSNTGGEDATSVVLTDELNTNLSLVAGSVKATPIAVADTYSSLGNVGIDVDAANGLLLNDISPDNTAMTATAVVDAATTDGGKITIDMDGSFTYTPKTGTAANTDSYTYTLNTSSGTSMGTVTFDIGISLWFVNSAAGSNGDGSLTSPFKDWSNFGVANTGTAGKPAQNQVIFVYSGTYSGGASLLDGQQIIGAGATQGLATILGISLPTYSLALPSTGQTAPNLTNATGTTITLAKNNRLRGFDMGNALGDISGNDFGTCTTSEMTLNGTGAALDLTNGTAALVFKQIVSENAPGNAVSLNGVGGTLSASNGTTITNSTGKGIAISGTSTVVADFGATNITGSGASGLEIIGGTSNTAQVGFGDLDIQADNGQKGIDAQFSGKLSNTSGTISSTSAEALNLIGDAGAKLNLNMVLDDVSVTGNSAITNGVQIVNTQGSFQIRGAGSTSGSGGVFTNITQRAIRIENATNITLQNINFTNASSTDGTFGVSAVDVENCNAGIFFKSVDNAWLQNVRMNEITGQNAQFGLILLDVHDFTLKNSIINNCGTSDSREAALISQNGSGRHEILNATLTYASRLVRYYNNANTLELLVDASTFKGTRTLSDASTLNANGQSGILIEGYQNANLSVDIGNSCQFLQCATQGVDAYANDNSTVKIDIQDSNFDSRNGNLAAGEDVGTGVDLASTANGVVQFNVIHNTVTGRGAALINVYTADAGKAEGKIDNNTIAYHSAAVLNNSGDGIRVNHTSSNRESKVQVSNNDISGIKDMGSFAVEALANGTPTSGGLLSFICSDNTLSVNANPTYNIRIVAADGLQEVCSNVSDNAIKVGGGGLNGYAQFRASSSGNVQNIEGSGDISSPHLSIWNNNGNTPSISSNTMPTFISVGGSGTNNLVAANTCEGPSNSLLNFSPNASSARMAALHPLDMHENSGSKVTPVESELAVKKAKAESVSQNSGMLAESKEMKVVGTETVTVNGSGSGFTLPAGKSTTVTFSATISNSPTVCDIPNTATINGGNFTEFNSNTTTSTISVPQATDVTPAVATAVCDGQSISMSAVCASGKVNWYAKGSSDLLGTVDSGEIFSQTPSSTVTYQAACALAGCESPKVNTAEITVNPLGDASFTYSGSPFCKSESNPKPTVTGDAGGVFSVESANLRISPSTGEIDLSGSESGTYDVKYTVTDPSTGCSTFTTQSITIVPFDEFTFSYGAATYCQNGDVDPTPSLTGSTGGTFTVSPIGLSIDPNSGKIDLSESTADTYFVKYTSAGACPFAKEVKVIIEAPDDASFAYSASAYCKTDLDPTPTVTGLSGGTFSSTPGLSINASTGQIDISASTGGTYTVRYTTQGTCPAYEEVSVSISNLAVSVTGQSNVSCNGGSDGSITVNASGGVGLYTYEWSPSGGNDATADNLSAGQYTVKVTDESGCYVEKEVTVTEPLLLTASASVLQNVSCNGGNDGKATVLASGGTGEYTYQWSPEGGTAATAENLSAGNYSVRVTDENGCFLDKLVQITEPLALSANAIVTKELSCFGGNDATAKVTVSGGTQPYSYSWSVAGQTLATIEGLTAGNYSVTVTDDKGCTKNTSVTVNEFAEQSFSFSDKIDPTFCEGENGQLEFATQNIADGTYNLKFVKNNQALSRMVNVSSGQFVLESLSKGEYKSFSLDVSVCTFTLGDVRVLSDPVFETSASNTGPYEVGETIQLMADSGNEFIWTGPNGFYSTLQAPSIPSAKTVNAGEYRVIVTAANACMDTAYTTVSVACLPLAMDYYLAYGGEVPEIITPLRERLTVQKNEERPMTILAVPNCEENDVESVRLQLSGTSNSQDRTDNVPLYALHETAGVVSGDYLEVNYYTFIANAYAQDNAQGSLLLGPDLIHFFIVDGERSISSPVASKWQFCNGGLFTVSADSSGKFINGNLFNVYLSDANGGFTNRRLVGFGKDPQNIACQIPNDLPSGDDYKLMVVSTAPVVSSAVSVSNLSIIGNDLVLVSPDDDLNGQMTSRRAVSTVKASNAIEGNAQIEYGAGKHIQLNPGFSVSPGAVFTTELKNQCPE